MGVKLQIDDSEVKASLNFLIKSLIAGYEAPLQKSAELISGNIRDNFLFRGGFDRNEWAALAPATIKNRQAKVNNGLQLFAQLDSPELLTGKMFHAATDITGSREGSGYAIDDHSVSVGIETDVITYAERAMGLLPGNIPVRDPIQISAETENEILSTFEADLNRRVQDAG